MSNFSILEASMLCHQLPLIFRITATNSYGCAVRRHPVFLQNSTISLCSLRLCASLFFQVAEKNKDVQLMDFVEIEFLAEQVEAIRKISEYFAQLRTLHKGHGLRGWIWRRTRTDATSCNDLCCS